MYPLAGNEIEIVEWKSITLLMSAIADSIIRGCNQGLLIFIQVFKMQLELMI